jgi:hypothetical protein
MTMKEALPVREDISSKLEIPFIPTLYPLHTSLYNRRYRGEGLR